MNKLFLFTFLSVLGLLQVSEKAVAQDSGPVFPSTDLLPAPAAEADLQTGGVFYVLNAGANKFLTRTVGDNSYGTRACTANFISADESGFADDSYQFTVEYSAEEGYYTFFSNGLNVYKDVKNGYLFADGNSTWVDQGTLEDNGKWNLQLIADNTFSIKSRTEYATDPTAYMAPQSASNYSYCWSDTKDTTAVNVPYIGWKFYKAEECADYISAVKAYEIAYEKIRLEKAIEKAERLIAEKADADLSEAVAAAKEILNTATSVMEVKDQTNVVYAAITGYLTSAYSNDEVALENPNLETDFTGWTQTGAGASGTGVAEFYQQNNSTFVQTVTLPAGKYKLVAQAFCRLGGNTLENAYNWANDPIEAGLYVKVNGIAKSSPIPSAYSIPMNVTLADQINGYVNRPATARTLFSSGSYPADMNFDVMADGNVEVGITSGPTAGSRWICFSDFKLMRIGDASATATQEQIDQLNALIAQAEELVGDKTSDVAKTLQEFIDLYKDQYTTASSSVDVADVTQTLSDEISNFNAAYELFDSFTAVIQKAEKATEGDISPAAATLKEDVNFYKDYTVDEADLENAAEILQGSYEAYRSTYIKNYSFEAEEDQTTTGVSPTLQDWERNYIDGYNWNGCNGDWKTDGNRSYGIWKPAIDKDFEVSQTITLPNGLYEVSVDMTVSKRGSDTRMNGQRLFAGNMEVYYPASAETPSDNGAPYTLKVRTVVTDGTLKLGIRTDGSPEGTDYGVGWFKVDDFGIKQLSEETTLILSDDMDFHAVEDQEMNVSYTRNFSAENVKAAASLHGWQSISLPFLISTIKYGEKALVAGTDFWLYEVTDGKYVEAVTLEYNKPYLIAVPSDPNVPATTISGDIVFSGDIIVGTHDLPSVNVSPDYTVMMDYKASNTGYGIADETVGDKQISVFRQGKCNGAFWPYALPTSTTPDAMYGIFVDLTSVPEISGTFATKDINVISVENGIEVTVSESQMIQIYTFSGELVKAVKVPAGTSLLFLPAGGYLVAGEKVIVEN